MTSRTDLPAHSRVSVVTLAAAAVEQLGKPWTFFTFSYGTEARIVRGVDWEADVSFELEPEDEGLILYTRVAADIRPHFFAEWNHTSVGDLVNALVVRLRQLTPQVEEGMRASASSGCGVCATGDCENPSAPGSSVCTREDCHATHDEHHGDEDEGLTCGTFTLTIPMQNT
ncbi:hypothetical protein AB0P15_36630 [Streptomyces sp. NPDC087917]|uniref:hypothetical protein n=1 Tax=Streptomyces sp. NPDC087917 TaxID=3155060 RepID=UPI00343C6289